MAIVNKKQRSNRDKERKKRSRRLGASSPKLQAEADLNGVQAPTVQTLRIYGLTTDEYFRILKRQGWKCPICKRTGRRWNIDHDHATGWKKLPPEERKLHVRGVTCWHCNYKILGPMSLELAKNAYKYLDNHRKRRDRATNKS